MNTELETNQLASLTQQPTEQEQKLFNSLGFQMGGGFDQSQLHAESSLPMPSNNNFVMQQQPNLNMSPQSEPTPEQHQIMGGMVNMNAIPTRLSPQSMQMRQLMSGYQVNELSPLPSSLDGLSQATQFRNDYQFQGQMMDQSNLMVSPYSPPRGFFSPGMQMQQRPELMPMISPAMQPMSNHHNLSPSMPMFMNAYDGGMKFHPASSPYGMYPYGSMKMRRGLQQMELETLFQAANSHPSATRAKRDTAIICLILDIHLSSGTITRLNFQNVPSIIRMIREGTSNYEGHSLEIFNSASMFTSRLNLHPLTAWALKTWILELITAYQWNVDDINLPLFVNSQPLYNNETGEKSLRQIPLKRDAISKVFQSVKQRSGINCNKTVVSASSLQSLTPVYPQLINSFQQEWSD